MGMRMQTRTVGTGSNLLGWNGIGTGTTEYKRNGSTQSRRARTEGTAVGEPRVRGVQNVGFVSNFFR